MHSLSLIKKVDLKIEKRRFNSFLLCYFQGWRAGAMSSRVFLAPWSRSRLRKKKSGAGAAWKKSGAGAAKKLTSSSALLEDKKHKEIVRL